MTERGATERRAAVEMRAAGRRLEGHAAVFNVETRIGSVREVIRPGAFRASLAEGRDIVALVDHSPSHLLARRSSGTLRLEEDSRGLAFSLDLPDTQLGRDTLALAERRDLGGASFSFVVSKDGEAWPTSDLRELRAVHLLEVSVVSCWPAYSQTSVMARSRLLPAVIRRRRLLETLR